MDWLKRHADTVAVIATIFLAMNWMNGKFHEADEKIAAMELRFEKRFQDIDTRLVRIETVLFLRGIMPAEYASSEETVK